MSKKFSRILSVMVVLALCLSCAVCGTMAKYISATTGEDAATVAKWSFEVNDAQFATKTAQTLTFSLFETIKDSNGTDNETNVLAVTGEGNKLIAPGTSGSFQIKVDNLSDVNATYTLALTETNAAGLPIEYSLDGREWYDDMTEINADQTDVALAMTSGTNTETIYWRWVYEVDEDGNVADTGFGIDAQTAPATVTVSATLTATQVN